MMNLGELEVGSVVFRSHPDGNVYYVLTDGPKRTALDWAGDFPIHPVKMVSGHYIDDTDGRFYLLACVDCMDPAVYIVRARSFETAYEVFCDEFAEKAGFVVSESDAADYPEDEREYNGNGQHIDAQHIQGFEVEFVAAFSL